MKIFIIVLRFLLIILSINLIAGFVSFIYLIKKNFSEEDIISSNTKHIIVATGGSNRILKGLQLAQIENDRKMLITGVGKGIQKDDIAKAILAYENQKQVLNCCVDLGLSALNTQGNAHESYRWLKRHRAQSTFLVTANYHMPRLVLEFERIAPEIKVNLVPVQPSNDPIQKIYLPKNLILLTKEYLKFVIKKLHIEMA